MFGFLGFALVVFIIGGIVYLAIRPRGERREGLTAHTLLVAYFYFVIAASLITIAVGSAWFIHLV
ncbi:MAG: hypothetical protein NTU41_07675 [Chloroflexi bacterium]|nr:hypothetical protein [Chloroflexota bacterium]